MVKWPETQSLLYCHLLELFCIMKVLLDLDAGQDYQHSLEVIHWHLIYSHSHVPVQHTRLIRLVLVKFPSGTETLSVFVTPKTKIPCGHNRSRLVAEGLTGKVRFNSSLKESELMAEIRSVFRGLMGEENDFPFHILQPNGVGTKTLGIPSTSIHYQWTPREIAKWVARVAYTYWPKSP